MKRIIYTLTAIFSAVAAAIYIMEYIAAINQFGELFISYYCIMIAVLLAIAVLSIVHLKTHTPKITLLLCGYVFYDSVLTVNSSQYLFGLLLMAVALVPAVYEFSYYGMIVRQEPQRSEKNRWLLAAALALAFALCAYTVMLIVLQATLNQSGGVLIFSADYIGITSLLSAAAFCALMNRCTSVLYRMFFAGCVIFYAIQTIFLQYIFMHFYLPDSADIFFISMAAIYALFVLLILVHALITRRGSLMSLYTPVTEQTLNQDI